MLNKGVEVLPVMNFAMLRSEVWKISEQGGFSRAWGCAGFSGHTCRFVSSNFTDTWLLVWVGCCDSDSMKSTDRQRWQQMRDPHILFIEHDITGLPDLIVSAATLIHPFYSIKNAHLTRSGVSDVVETARIQRSSCSLHPLCWLVIWWAETMWR